MSPLLQYPNLSNHYPVVSGIGSVAYIPEAVQLNDPNVFHSADYLYHKERIIGLPSISLIGSGQSAAEIFHDLLYWYEGRINWYSRSRCFYPMDYSKFNLELSTPNYIDHYYKLSAKVRHDILSGQDFLYKGINASLISEIYELVSDKDSNQIHIHPNCELRKIQEDLTLHLFHREIQKEFEVKTDAVILATGYAPIFPEFMEPLKPEINFANGNFIANRNYSIDKAHTFFVQNAEQVTHGFNSSDLSLGPYRNAVILNTILKTEHFKIERSDPIQRFGLPDSEVPL